MYTVCTSRNLAVACVDVTMVGFSAGLPAAVKIPQSYICVQFYGPSGLMLASGCPAGPWYVQAQCLNTAIEESLGMRLASRLASYGCLDDLVHNFMLRGIHTGLGMLPMPNLDCRCSEACTQDKAWCQRNCNCYALCVLTARPTTRGDLLTAQDILHLHAAIRSALESFADSARALQEASHGEGSSKALETLVERHRFLRAVCACHNASEEEVLMPAARQLCQCEDMAYTSLLVRDRACVCLYLCVSVCVCAPVCAFAPLHPVSKMSTDHKAEM